MAFRMINRIVDDQRLSPNVIIRTLSWSYFTITIFCDMKNEKFFTLNTLLYKYLFIFSYSFETVFSLSIVCISFSSWVFLFGYFWTLNGLIDVNIQGKNEKNKSKFNYIDLNSILKTIFLIIFCYTKELNT